jgi:glucose-6-phosphate isomerase
MSETSLGELLDLMATRKPLVNVISKSGTTTEPGVAFRVIKDFMEKRFAKESAQRIIATTDGKKGALRKLAIECGYKTFEVPDDVGGRYSVLTAVGLVPLALHGIDIHAMISGAMRFFRIFAKTPRKTRDRLHSSTPSAERRRGISASGLRSLLIPSQKCAISSSGGSNFSVKVMAKMALACSQQA